MKEIVMNGLLKIASKIQAQRHMSAIRNAFSLMLPLFITGAFSTLLLNVVLSTTTSGMSLAKVDGFGWLANFSPMFEAANYATMNFMTIGIIVLIALELGKSYGHDEFILPVVALASYITLTKTIGVIDVDGTQHVLKNVLPSIFTNAQGLFLGMIASIVSSEIYIKIVKYKKFEIKMPDTVPSNVAKAFSVLVPSVITILTISAFGMVFEMIFNIPIYQAIDLLIQTPLKGIMTGLPGYLVTVIFTQLLWSFGIHGGNVMKPITAAPFMTALAENEAAVLAGEVPKNIINHAFNGTFIAVTGAGVTGALLIAVFIFSKRKDERKIAGLSVAPALFNINEPVIFGMPIVLNPIYMIPFILAPVASAIFAYYMTKVGFAYPMYITVPWTTPPLLRSFIATGGHIGTVITEAMSILLCTVIYTPFVLISNKQNNNQEML
ncbi:PTS sugar transporter subunit IIC [Erysipelothrix sp. HDW6A]|uniref:PTS sugar transporter subunit IIC n=1 Tax=Erysipelothrix sp. HDW6A TaxID=2714928 RepID=UPI0014072418|nr:PTS transporter subunit EIIC [Erysipelothrix sp. HDW6A]QIK57069.1 PTS sugar transporter subunit IIC [Erysipelothrix sp. HDW6A]